MLLTAAWFALFALPLLVTSHGIDAGGRPAAVGFFGAYRTLWAELNEQWRRDHNVVYYLVASAVFRDGLTGVFTFGAVLGVTVYGVSPADVLLFGVCACVIAAIGAVVGGLLDDRVGSKPVIVGSLERDDRRRHSSLMTLVRRRGVLGLRAAAVPLRRAHPVLGAHEMLRMSTEGKEGVAFGLYTTTGRAASFLAPLLFFTVHRRVRRGPRGSRRPVAVLALGLVGDRRASACRADRQRSSPATCTCVRPVPVLCWVCGAVDA